MDGARHPAGPFSDGRYYETSVWSHSVFHGGWDDSDSDFSEEFSLGLHSCPVSDRWISSVLPVAGEPFAKRFHAADTGFCDSGAFFTAQDALFCGIKKPQAKCPRLL